MIFLNKLHYLIKNLGSELKEKKWFWHTISCRKMNVPQILTLIFCSQFGRKSCWLCLKDICRIRHFLPPPWYQLPCKLPLLQISTNSLFDSPWFHPCPHIIQQSEWYSRSNHITPLLQRPSMASHFSSAQLLSRVRLFVTPLTAANQASLSITISWSFLKLMSIKLVMPSNHLILCHPLLPLHSVFPSIRSFSNHFIILALRTPWTVWKSFPLLPE